MIFKWRLGYISFFTLGLLGLVSAGNAEPIGPFKDSLFVYAPLIETSENGAVRRFQYDEMRDVNGRDNIAGWSARGKYIFRVPRGHRNLQVSAGKIRTPYYAAGAAPQKSQLTVVYIHGNGGNRKQGINIRTFGGNFGRVQNLVVLAGGRYLSPAFSTFGTLGASQIALLLQTHRNASPATPIVLACGSQGSLLCWKLAKDAKTKHLVDGMILLGGLADTKFISTVKAAGKKGRIPIFLAHGTRDDVFAWQESVALVKKLKRASANYPIRLDLFEGGIHGTPIRMIDWREALNWIDERLDRDK